MEFVGEEDRLGAPTGSAKLDVRLGPIEEDEVSFFFGASEGEVPVETGDFCTGPLGEEEEPLEVAVELVWGLVGGVEALGEGLPDSTDDLCPEKLFLLEIPSRD